MYKIFNYISNLHKLFDGIIDILVVLILTRSMCIIEGCSSDIGSVLRFKTFFWMTYMLVLREIHVS